jgi:hypothetical protein
VKNSITLKSFYHGLQVPVTQAVGLSFQPWNIRPGIVYCVSWTPNGVVRLQRWTANGLSALIDLLVYRTVLVDGEI